MRRQRSRVGWSKINSHPSKGWGLPRKWPGIPKFNKKRAVILLLLIVGGIFVSDQVLKYSAGSSPIPVVDPSTFIWHGLAPTNDLSEFNTVRTTFTTKVLDAHNYRSMDMLPNATQSSVALSKTPIDTSTVSGKELVLLTSFSASSLPAGSVSWGMYLTTNKTLPTQLLYDPYSDKAVALLFRFIPTGGAGTAQLYIQHNVIDTIQSEDNGGCGATGSSGSCFMAEGYADNPATHTLDGFVALNFTGAGGPGKCTGGFGNNGPGCSNLDVDNDFTGGKTLTNSTVVPNFNFQANNYYVGFYNTFTAAHIYFSFDSSLNTPLNCGIFDSSVSDGCNQVVNYVPSVTSQLPPNVDTGGFFGPVIKALISIGVFILQSIMQFLGYLAIAIKIALNAIGNFAGWGNIGDSFINAVTGIVNTMVQVGSAIANYLSGLVARGLDEITIATSFAGTFFTGLQEFMTEMKIIVGGIVTIFSKLFLWGGSFYFLYDMILYFQLTGDAGFEGIGTWIGFNKWAAFSTFGLLTRILNVLINAFDWILSHIPTIAARMPENGFPGIPQLEAGQFPGLRIPTGAVAKLREGDPAAFFLWAVGGFLILPFYLGSSISPLAGLTAAVGCNPTTCFNNMLTTVGYPFAGLFILLFVGVTISEILFGITDVGGERIVIQNKLPAGLTRTIKEAKGQFSFGTGKFANLSKGKAKGASKQAKSDKFIVAQSREQRYENKYGGMKRE
jgi:hypothetical protein